MTRTRAHVPVVAAALVAGAIGCQPCGGGGADQGRAATGQAPGNGEGVAGAASGQAPGNGEGVAGAGAGRAAGAGGAGGAADAGGLVPPAIAALGGFHRARPLWLAAPPDEPGQFTIDHIYRPVLSEDHRAVILASTALGCTALDLAGGRPLWRAHLPAPDGPVVAGHLAPRTDDPRCPEAELTCMSPHAPAGPWPPTPVATAAGNTIEVRGERLYAIRLDTARPAWTARGRYADCAGCLGPAPSGALWALALDSGTVSRAWLDPATGRTRRGQGQVPAIDVLAAAAAPGAPGALYAALRLDTTLTHDAVVAFDAAGRVTWSWIIPPPPSGPRVDPMALVAAPGRAVLFFDGRYAAALPPP